MDVVSKVGMGHHKDGDVGQAEQIFIEVFWYVPIYHWFNEEADVPTDVGKLGQFVLNSSWIYSDPEDCLSRKNYGWGKNFTGTLRQKHASIVLVAVLKVTCKMAIAPHRDTARASLKTIEDYWRWVRVFIKYGYGKNLVNRRIEDLQT